MKNPGMPGQIKIGRTDRHPRVRACELSEDSGIAYPWEVVKYWDVADSVTWERRVHSALDEFRINQSREMFQFDDAWEAVRCIEAIIQEAVIEVVEQPTGGTVPKTAEFGFEPVPANKEGWLEPKEAPMHGDRQRHKLHPPPPAPLLYEPPPPPPEPASLLDPRFRAVVEQARTVLARLRWRWRGVY